MSLILDALKKSEQERRRDRGPDLQTIHQSTSITAHAAGKSWRWLVVVVINVAVIGTWWWSQRESSPITPMSAAKTGRVAPVEVEIAPVDGSGVADSVSPSAQRFAQQSAPSSAQPWVQQSTQQTVSQAPSQATQHATQDGAEFTRIEPSAATAQPRVNAATPVEEFTDLPADVRNSLPAMTFSFHVYSADPRNRTIIINNQRLREGEQVSAGVALESITEDGVILAMDHRRVHINVLTGW